jgi:hypothetical protein
MSAARVPVPEAIKLLRKYDEDFLLCRNLGHLWEIVGYFKAPNGITCRSLACGRCGTERTDRWDAATAERHAPKYAYAEDYRLVWPEGEHASAADVRTEVMRRATVYANETTMLAAVIGNGK